MRNFCDCRVHFECTLKERILWYTENCVLLCTTDLQISTNSNHQLIQEMADPVREKALQDYRKKLLEHKEVESRLKESKFD